MNIRQSWLNDDSENLSSLFYSKEETIASVKRNFDFRRYNSAEGKEVEIDGIKEQVLIQSYTNPLNEKKEDKKIHCAMESNIKNGSYILYEDRHWMVRSKIDNVGNAYKSSQIYRCNNDLKWIDEYGYHELPCIYISNFSYASFDYNKNIILPDGTIVVEVQLNEETDKININKRFLFKELVECQAYKVTARDGASLDGILKLKMVKDNFAADDDKLEYIANKNQYNYSLTINQDDFEQSIGYTTQLSTTLTLNSEVITKDIEWISSDETICTVDSSGNIELLAEGSATITARMVENTLVEDSIVVNVVAMPSGVNEIIISPNVTKILQNQTQSYEVWNYVDSVKNLDTFTITSNGVDNSWYNLNVIDSNSFEVINLLGHNDVLLTITCTNNNTGDSKSIKIQLSGFW